MGSAHQNGPLYRNYPQIAESNPSSNEFLSASPDSAKFMRLLACTLLVTEALSMAPGMSGVQVIVWRRRYHTAFSAEFVTDWMGKACSI